MTEIIPFKRHKKPQDLVLRFLNSVGHKLDADFYLKLFSSSSPESFAVIVLEEDILKDEMDAVLFEIRYLMRLSLYPVVLIRSSKDFLERLEIESYFKKAHIALNFLSNEYSDDEKLEFIRARIKKQTLPLLHLEPDLDMIDEISKLATLLRTSKVIFLRKTGGILNAEDSALLSIINLNVDFETFVKENHIPSKQADFVKTCAGIINTCRHKIIISVVSPNNLLRELFTVKGAGTLIQRGSLIKTCKNWENIDPRSLKRLLEASFEKKIDQDFFTQKMDYFYIEENYLGAALLKDYKDTCYLSKFAVGTEARGLGVGRDLWGEIIKNHKKIFWRSRSDKFITHWYIKQCDGMHKAGEWTIFWKGLDQQQISDIIEYALTQKVDFIG
ncbi:MAG: hypothetical protein HQM16_09030 [Deltaproteobacteria bacterium]|nr:hypothetical protein [Deltaproteobacteria bacterium]